ncbi:MAG TPA: alcohol dehydrogenase catalytic domain-containing protein [Pirellulales bacterium]|nr:alcohol dehydrogenase catalytic domain-containing protein [Pirellulales bacterium]
MKAAVLKEIGKPLFVEEVAEPALEPDEVLVETRTCGICRTDLHIQEGLAYVPRLPHIPGHEPAGIVVAVGSEVAEPQVGQAVVPHLFVFDRDCPYTRSGQHAQATHLRGILGVSLPGGFAQYFKAPARNLLRVPEGVPWDVAGLTSCAVITAVHAFRKAQLAPLDTAVVLGAGGIGLILVQLLRASGVTTIVVDRSAASLEQARQAGAELAVSFDDVQAVDQVRAAAGAGKDGADCVFELVGRAATMKFAAAAARRGGRIVVIGEEAEFPSIDTITLAQRELQLIGSRNGGLQDALDALNLLARGVLRPPIAAHFPLERINDAFDLVRSGQANGRVIVTLT